MLMPHLLLKTGAIAFSTFAVGLIDEKTGIPIGVAFTIAGAWAGAVWWIGRKLQSLEDGLKIQKQALDLHQKMVKMELDQNNALAKTQREAIIERLDSLPCNDCKTKKHHETNS